MSEKATRMDTTRSVYGEKKKKLTIYLVVVGILVGALFAFSHYYLRSEKAGLEADLADRQGLLTSTRADNIDKWVARGLERIERLAKSDIFELFASEVDQSPSGVPVLFGDDNDNEETQDDDGRLRDRLPFMHTLLRDFVSDNKTDFFAATIVNSKCEPYMTTEATMAPLSRECSLLVRQVVETGYHVFSPLELGPRGATLDFLVPIFPPQHMQSAKRPAAVLIITVSAETAINEALASGVFGSKTQRLALVQRTDNKFQEIDISTSSLRIPKDFSLDQQKELSFGIRHSPVLRKDVYSSGVKTRSLDWWIVAETELKEIAGPVTEKSQAIYIVCGLISAVLVLLVVAVWWRFVGREQSALNEGFRELLSVIEEQKQLLDGINSTISDPITLVDASGKFVYCNKAFGQAVGRLADEVIGLDGQAVFGFDTAKRLNQSDQHVLMTGEPLSINETLWLQSKRHFYQISKAPLLDSKAKKPTGIVSVYRDITQIIESEQHSRRVVQQTIDALVHAIEQVDPFLGGHSYIMSEMAALIAKQLNLSGADAATIEAAASLSQIGKLFVPREILLKPGTLSDAEKEEMEKHVEYTCSVLKDIEFDLPVVKVIQQMNENIDGTGYPAGLKNDAISIHARVLAVANAFAAMVRPRSYREALPITKVMEMLDKATGTAYDSQVVEALREVIVTPQGERIVDQAARKKAV